MGIRGLFDRFVAESEHYGKTLDLLLRVGLQTGLLGSLNLSAIEVILKAAIQNKNNPSTLYRYQAAMQPGKTAIRWKNTSLSFAQVDDQITQLCNGLRSMGLNKGSHAILMMKNRPELIIAQPAMSRLGGSGVSISWRSTARELAYMANHSKAEAILFEHDVAESVALALPQIPHLNKDRVFSVGGKVKGFPAYEELLSRIEAEGNEGPIGDDSGVIIYTSGTTGDPKGAVRRFPKNVLPGTLAILSNSPLQSTDTHLAVLPFYHSTAFAFTSFSHLLGATVVIQDDLNPMSILRSIERHQITQTAMVPTLLHRILDIGIDCIRTYNTKSLRAVVCAGAPLSGSLAARFMDVFGDILWNYYGATETGLSTCANPIDLRLSPGTIGRPILGNEIRLLDETGKKVPDGEIGELFVKGPLMVVGYHNDEAATQDATRNGFFSVGDMAWIDARGCYHLAGRKTDMIISGGVNVYPAEIERVLESHPFIAEAAVLGVDDVIWGESVKAFVVLQANSPADALSQIDVYCKEQLAGPKRPRLLILLPQLPRNPTGKVLKNELRAL